MAVWGRDYRIETRAGPLDLQSGRLDVAVLTSGVFVRAEAKTRATFATGPLPEAWVRLEQGAWSAATPRLVLSPNAPGARDPGPPLQVRLRDLVGTQPEPVDVERLQALVEIKGGLARTELTLTLRNTGHSPIEVVLALPIPIGATVTGLDVPGSTTTFQARKTAWAKVGIPGHANDLSGFIEWSRGDLYRLCVAPVTSVVQVTIRTRQRLPLVGGRYRYTLPLAGATWQGLRELDLEVRVFGWTSVRTNRQLQSQTSDTETLVLRTRDVTSAEDLHVWIEAPTPQVLADRSAPDRSAPALGTYLIRVRPRLAATRRSLARVFLIDTSLALNPEDFTARLEALETLLDELPASDPFAVIAFDATSEVVTKTFVTGRVARRQALERLRSRGSLGASDLEGGLHRAADLVRGRPAGQVVLLSGGPVSFGELRPAALARLARRALPDWRFSVLAVGEVRDEVLASALVGQGGQAIHAQARIAGAAAFRLAHALEFPGVKARVVLRGAGVPQQETLQTLAPNGEIVLFGRYSRPGARVLEVHLEHEAPQVFRLELPTRAASPMLRKLWARQEALRIAHAPLPHPGNSLALALEAGVLTPETALVATRGGVPYANWHWLDEAYLFHPSNTPPRLVREAPGPLAELDLDRFLPGRRGARGISTVWASLALEVHYREERAARLREEDPWEGDGWDEEEKSEKEKRKSEKRKSEEKKSEEKKSPLLGPPARKRVHRAPVRPPLLPIQKTPEQSDQALGIGCQIESELSEPPPERKVVYLERGAPRTRSTTSDCGGRVRKRYLARIRNEDGSWGSPPSIEATALTLLCFLRNGHTHRFGEFKRTVNRAVRWLRARQLPDGDFGGGPRDQALATLAICELYSISRDFTLREPVKRALARLLALQRPDGGWAPAAQPRSDLMTTALAVDALAEARLAARVNRKAGPLDVPKMAFANALVYLDGITSPDGAVGSCGLPVGDEIDLNHTAAVAVARRLAGASPSDERLVGAARHLFQLTKLPGERWFREAFPADGYRLLHSGTRLLIAYGGQSQRIWSKWLQRVLYPSNVPSGPHEGSWNPPGPLALKPVSEDKESSPIALAVEALRAPALAATGQGTIAALNSLALALGEITDPVRLEGWREAADLAPMARAAAGIRRALLHDLSDKDALAAEAWLATWRAAGPTKDAERFLSHAEAAWERAGGLQSALQNLLALPYAPSLLRPRAETVLRCLLRDPDPLALLRRVPMLGPDPARHAQERRLRVVLLGAFTVIHDEGSENEISLLEETQRIAARPDFAWERLAAAYMSAKDPRGVKLRAAIVASGEQHESALKDLAKDARRYLKPGAERFRAATSHLQVYWGVERVLSDSAQLLDEELGPGAGLDLLLAAVGREDNMGSLLQRVVEGALASRRTDVARLAIQIVDQYTELTFSSAQERDLRRLNLDGAPELKAPIRRLLENDLEAVMTWDNEQSGVELDVRPVEGGIGIGLSDTEPGRILHLCRRTRGPLRFELSLAEGSPPTRARLTLTYRSETSQKRTKRWTVTLRPEARTRSLTLTPGR
ncbi:MAG: hypothetical protein JKY65_27340 [Planctomycetes bacterium]|nr:hypothetical protein [Planctomycetota bacterium]